MRAAVSRPFYIARFLIEIGDPSIFCPFAGAHAGDIHYSPAIRAHVQGGTHLWHFSTAQ